MSELVIKVQSLSKSFGKNSVLDSLDLNLVKGTIYGLVGLNGAGKTTLVRLLLGLLKPDSGVIDVLGHNPWGHKPDYYRTVGALLEHDGFWGNLTFNENLKFFAQARNVRFADVAKYLKEHWQNSLLPNSTKKVKHYSRGQRMQCALCRTFLGWPKVCFLDEPTVALDMNAYDHFCELVRTAKKRECTVLISSHHFEAIDILCDRVGILQDSQLKDLDNTGTRLDKWIIRADNLPEYGDIIKEITGTGVRYKNGKWEFSVSSKESQIPKIITSLISKGCKIEEVRPAERIFRDTVRKVYTD